MNTVQRITQRPMYYPIVAGVCCGFIGLALEALILSVFLNAGPTGEDSLVKYTYIVHAIALLIAGFTAGKRSSNRGWYNGGITGSLYMLIVLLIGFLAMNVSLSWDKWILILLAFVVSAIGGIIGVNMKK